MFKRVLSVLAGLSVAGCVTAVDPVQRNTPLKMAFSESVPSLEQRANDGDKAAQYALSFLLRFGFRGVAVDRIRSDGLRAQAGAPSSHSQPIYVPGVNGNPGHTMMVPITTPGVSDGEARRMDLCGLSILASQPAMGGQICGSPAAFIDLLPSAQAAMMESGPMGLSRPAVVDPASVTTCETTRPLWLDAINRFETSDHTAAAIRLDRIIGLCGEAETSWHPRVMRALIATQQDDPKAAVAFLAPVPRPAPAPIGGYVGFVAMQAQAAAGDWNAYRQERDQLSAASLSAFKADRAVKAVSEPFVVDGTRVQLFDRRLPMGSGLDTVMTGLVSLSGDRDEPRTYYVTMSADFEKPSSKQYFLDEYRCDGRSTLMYFGALNAAPDATTIRALIEKRLAGDLEPASGSSFDRGLSACQFPAQVAPGLGDS